MQISRTLPLLGLLLQMAVFPVHASDLLRWLSGLDFSELGEKAVEPFQGDPKADAEARRQEVQALVEKAQTVLNQADDVDLKRVLTFTEALGVEWNQDYLTQAGKAPYLAAYAKLSEFVGVFMQTKSELLTAFTELMRDYRILEKTYQQDAYREFDFSGDYQDRTYTESAMRDIDAFAHSTTLSMHMGEVDKQIRRMEKRISQARSFMGQLEKALGQHGLL